MENLDIEPLIGQDLHFHNGLIWDDEKNRFTDGELVIRDGMISEVTFRSQLPRSASRGSEKIDLKGGFLSPSFLDGHMHLFQWSITRKGIDLSNCRNVKEIVATIKDVADGSVSNTIFDIMGIIFGTSYDDSRFQGQNLKNGNFLDDEFEGIPVVVTRVCGHKALLNEEGSDLLDIDPELINSGVIIDDPAMEIPWKIPFTPDLNSILLGDAIRSMFELGVTGGVDIIPSSQIEGAISSYSRVDLNMALSISLIRDDEKKWIGKNPPMGWKDLPNPNNIDDVNMPVVFEKFFLDGSIGSKTASFTDDYLDAKREPPIFSDKELEEKVMNANKSGFVPMVHCIGDRAIEQAISVLQDLPHLYRLEHAESITKEHLKKMDGARGALCMQPNFQNVWGDPCGLYDRTLGDRRLDLNKFRTVQGSGIPWCFGTDMMPPGPLFAIKGAINHQNRFQRLTRHESMRGFTTNVADLSFLSNQYSTSLSPGCHTDLVIIDRNFEKVLMTIRLGNVVYNYL